jgi:CHAT domain-containing protein
MHLLLRSLGRMTAFTVLLFTVLLLGEKQFFQDSIVLGQTATTRAQKVDAERLFEQGIQQLIKNQFQAAQASWDRALEIYRNIGDRPAEQKLLKEVGGIYLRLRESKKAIYYLQQYLFITKEIGNRKEEGIALGSLGSAYYSLGKYATAIDLHRQHLAIARDIQDIRGEGAALGNLGTVFSALGQHTKALDFRLKALKIRKDTGDFIGEGLELSNIGVSYTFLGEYAKAVDYYQQSLILAREINNYSGEGTILGGLGTIYFLLNQYPKAIDFYQQSLALTQKIKDRQGEAVALNGLGNVHVVIKEYNKAINFYQQFLAIARETGDRRREALAFNNLGRTFLQIRRLTEAERLLLAGIQLYESLRSELKGEESDAYRISIFNGQARTYRSLQQVLTSAEKKDAALEIAERGRANALVDLLSLRFQSPAQPLPSLDKAFSLRQIQQVAKSRKATLVLYSLIYDDLNILEEKKVRESDLYIWVVQPTKKITFRSVKLASLLKAQDTSLIELVTESREVMGARGRGNIAVKPVSQTTIQKTQTSQKLHQLLIDPIADLLPNDSNDRVIFLPQGALFFAPFAALQDRKGIPLIEKHTISTAPSIQTLDFTQKRRQTLKAQKYDLNALVVGNPIMPKVQFIAGEPPHPLSPLPGAESEAREIAQTLQVQPLTGSKATKATIVPKLSNTRIVHLATHGLLDDFRGLGVPGAIALGPSGKDNGLLTADEIFNLKLNAELVVLSACDTGRGNLTGDGVVGLSRSLIAAGVSSVVVSLWKVPDEPTALLMKEFYRNLQQNPNKAQALRQAMLATKQKYPDPLNWAAFTLIGEAE